MSITSHFSRLVAWFVCCAVIVCSAEGQVVGPRNGALVIHGGGRGAAEAVDRFLKLAGGPNALILIIPTAAGDENYDHFDHLVMRRLRDLGAVNLRVVHARTRAEANSAEFSAVIASARGVWFTGGRQWRLADTYLGTRTEKALHDLLERGGVIGGGSAGATIQGSYLVRGDTRGEMVMMGDHELGFSFLKHVAIDQHLLSRNRQFDLIGVVRAHPELLGIGIDENTAIIVKDDKFEVVGEGYVAIYDPEVIHANGRFYFLSAHDRFDLATRVPSEGTDNSVEMWMPQIRSVLALTSTQLLSYVGVYANGELRVRISTHDGHLIAQKDGETPMEIRPLSRTVFFNLYTGSKATFSVDERDCVRRLTWPADGVTHELQKLD
jgi:cyanophycinase